jgi:hypothetical protein
MKRLIVLVACLVLASAACKKSSEAPAASEPEAQPAATAPAAEPAQAEAAPAEPKAVEITDAMVQKYMEYQAENIALVRQYAAETSKNLESAKGDAMKTLNQISINEKLSKEMEAKLDAKRQGLGLAKDDFEVLKEAASMLATSRALYNQMGGDAQLAKMEAEHKAQVAKLPAEKRAEAEQQMGDFTKSLKDVRDGVDLRKKYGDKNADVLLKYADPLAKQWTDALSNLGKK